MGPQRGPDQAALTGGADSRQPPVGAERKVDELDVMHGHVSAWITPGDPFGKLTVTDGSWLEQAAIAIVDVLQYAVDDMGAQFFMIGIRQLMIDDLGEGPIARCRLEQDVQFLQTQNGGLLNKNMLAGFQGKAGGLVVPVIGGGDTDGIHILGEQARQRLGASEAGKSPDTIVGLLTIALRTCSGPACHGRQHYINEAKIAPIQTFGVHTFEKRAIGFIEDHPQADHAGTQGVSG